MLLWYVLLGMLIIGCLLGSLITQYLFKRHSSRGTFVLVVDDKEDETDYRMYVSFEEPPQELCNKRTKYIILEKKDEKC